MLAVPNLYICSVNYRFVIGAVLNQVRESLLTSALLRIPLEVSRAEKEKLVDHIIDELVRISEKKPVTKNAFENLLYSNHLNSKLVL